MLTSFALSLIAVRILALSLIIERIASVPAWVTIWGRSERIGFATGFFWTAVVGPLLAGIALLVGSRRLARWIAPRETETGEGTANLATVQAVAIATLGLYLIALNLPVLIASVLELREAGNAETALNQIWYPAAVSHTCSVLIGILLCTGASFWTRLFRRFRNLGYESSARSEPPDLST